MINVDKEGNLKLKFDFFGMMKLFGIIGYLGCMITLTILAFTKSILGGFGVLFLLMLVTGGLVTLFKAMYDDIYG